MDRPVQPKSALQAVDLLMALEALADAACRFCKGFGVFARPDAQGVYSCDCCDLTPWDDDSC